jgi:drug/metabolite transporter (DMT)-like permease
LQKSRVRIDNKKKALLATGLAGVMWGTSFPAIKFGLRYMDAYSFAFLRFLVASLIMLSILLTTKNFQFKLDKKRLTLFLGVTNGVAYLLQYAGMVFTTASKASLFVNLSAVWVALLSPIVLKEHLGSKKTLGVIVSLLGVFFVTTNLNWASLSQGVLMGDLLVVSCGVLWAFFMVYNKPLATTNKNLFPYMTWILLFTLIPMLPPAVFSGGAVFPLPLEAWLTIFYTAIFCWVLPYYLWLKGLKHISATTSAVVLLIEIIVAMIIATLALGEVLTLISGIGALFIILAILLVS